MHTQVKYLLFYDETNKNLGKWYKFFLVKVFLPCQTESSLEIWLRRLQKISNEKYRLL